MRAEILSGGGGEKKRAERGIDLPSRGGERRGDIIVSVTDLAGDISSECHRWPRFNN